MSPRRRPTKRRPRPTRRSKRPSKAEMLERFKSKAATSKGSDSPRKVIGGPARLPKGTKRSDLKKGEMNDSTRAFAKYQARKTEESKMTPAQRKDRERERSLKAKRMKEKRSTPEAKKARAKEVEKMRSAKRPVARKPKAKPLSKAEQIKKNKARAKKTGKALPPSRNFPGVSSFEKLKEKMTPAKRKATKETSIKHVGQERAPKKKTKGLSVGERRKLHAESGKSRKKPHIYSRKLK